MTQITLHTIATNDTRVNAKSRPSKTFFGPYDLVIPPTGQRKKTDAGQRAVTKAHLEHFMLS